MAKISFATAKNWAKESRENPDGPKGAFWPMLGGALAKSLLKAAADARQRDPRWFLARMRPKRFGDPSTKVDLNAKVDLTANYRHGQFEADIERILKLRKKKGGDLEPVESDEEARQDDCADRD